MKPSKAHNEITVGILDGNTLMREGLVSLFQYEPGFKCVGSWGDVDEALQSLSIRPPNVVLADIKLPEKHGFDMLKRLTANFKDLRIIVTVDCPEERCVVINPNSPLFRSDPSVFETCSAPDDCLQIALKVGAHGVLRKQCSFSYLLQAIKTVNAGQYWMELTTANRLARQYLLTLQGEKTDCRRHSGVGSLTLRERQIIYLISQGKSNKEICRELRLAYSTVKNYVSSILEKLELSDRTQIALYAMEPSQFTSEKKAEL